MQQISDKKALEEWLQKQPREVVVVIAARAALRVLPLVADEFEISEAARNHEEIGVALILPIFRAVPVPWLAAVSPSPGTDTAAAAAAYAAADADAAADAADAAAGIWEEINFDVSMIESESIKSEDIALQPLWRNRQPTEFRQKWDSLKEHLISSREGWEVWMQWYEARLEGGWTHRELDEEENRDIETARVLIDEKIWNSGPAVVNAEISRVIGDKKYRDDILAKARVTEKAKTPKKTRATKATTKPKPRPPKPPPRENTRTHSDDPAVEDLLNRRPFARAIVEKMNEVRRQQGGDGFAVHLHGAWGSGKTSILNFMEEYLSSELEAQENRWIVIKFNAWEHERIHPPWWPLLQVIYDGASDKFEKWPWIGGGRSQTLKSVWCRWLLKTRWSQYWKTAAFFAFASIAIYFGPGIGGVLGTIGSILALVALSFKPLLALVHGSSEAADSVNQLAADTMKPFSNTFSKLIEATGQPVVIFIDDLDRCNADYVVDLLEGIQTLFRHPNVAYVIAADRKWIRASFETRYKDFSGHMRKAGQPLGYLFLEKIFQMSTTVPGMGEANKAYWSGLLAAQKNVPEPDEFDQQVRQERDKITRELGSDTTQARLDAYIKDTGDSAFVRAAAALELASAPAAQAETRHMLEQYVAAVPENPRGMKRIVNAFGLRRAIRMLEADPLSVDVLARWTIIEQRWPEFADELIIRPYLIDLMAKQMKLADIAKLPDSIQILANDTALLATLKKGRKTVLKESHVRSIAGL